MNPSFLQVFHDDDVLLTVLDGLKQATGNWLNSSIQNEGVLLNEVANVLQQFGSKNCKSSIYPSIAVKAERTILDRKAQNNSDLFGADLAVTLSMDEDGELIKQRTALLQLKISCKEGAKSKFKMDVRQIYISGHNKHSLGRWFMVTCELQSGIWKFASEREIAKSLIEDQLSKAAFHTQADRDIKIEINENWHSISEWLLDWLAEASGTDSDLSDLNRLEMVLQDISSKLASKKSSQNMGVDFDSQFSQFAGMLPRTHIHYKISLPPKRKLKSE